MEKFGFGVIHPDVDSRLLVKFGGNWWRRSDQNNTRYIGRNIMVSDTLVRTTGAILPRILQAHSFLMLIHLPSFNDQFSFQVVHTKCLLVSLWYEHKAYRYWHRVYGNFNSLTVNLLDLFIVLDAYKFCKVVKTMRCHLVVTNIVHEYFCNLLGGPKNEAILHFREYLENY